jgi:hypothetical protein
MTNARENKDHQVGDFRRDMDSLKKQLHADYKKNEAQYEDHCKKIKKLFEMHTIDKNKETYLPSYITGTDIEIFVSTFPTLVNDSTQQKLLRAYLEKLCQVEQIKKTFIINDNIRNMMLNLNSESSISSYYAGLLIPYLHKKSEQEWEEDNIDIDLTQPPETQFPDNIEKKR